MDQRVARKKAKLSSMSFIHSCSTDFYIQHGYMKVCNLGKGITGDVMMVRSRDNINDVKAVKTFKKKSGDKGTLNELMFLQEVAILQNIEHKNILGNILACSDPDKNVICMPYYREGTLLDQLPTLKSHKLDQYLVQLTSALQYLHGRRWAHRDIKPENVLISDEGDAILADFGLSCEIKSSQMLNPGICGTKDYIAPELMDTTIKYIDFRKCDMFSLGVLLWNMLSRSHVGIEDIFLDCLQNQKTESGSIQHVLEQLLRKDFNIRWSAEQLSSGLATIPRMKHLIKKYLKKSF